MTGRSRRLADALAAAFPALIAGGRPVEAAGELSFFNWTNWFPPELPTKFEKDTGIKVTMDGYDGNETLHPPARAGRRDPQPRPAAEHRNKRNSQ